MKNEWKKPQLTELSSEMTQFIDGFKQKGKKGKKDKKNDFTNGS